MNEIYNCKERFGYVYLWTCDENIQNILLDYCEKRSYLWNLFFGWRKTCFKTGQMFFWIPKNKINLLEREEK